MYDLSVIIPARSEMFLALTVENILKNIRGNTEIIVVLDGAWADPGIPDNDRVTLIYNHESIGQRAATNQAVRMSRAKYVMKIDAHCVVDEGFDVKLMKDMQDDWTVVPTLYNLYGFDWVCPDGHKRYQGPSGPCKDCGKPTKRDIVWKPRMSRKSTSYCFDSEPHFQYFGDYKKIQDKQGQLVDTMSLQGSCFMLTRDKYIELNICDEAFGSWGSQGIELSCKTWLSGGRVVVNKNTWYSHLFRTQGSDFGFPYPLSGRQVDHAKKYAKELFFNNKWEKQIYPLSWLLEKFWPIKGWTNEQLADAKKLGAMFTNLRAKKLGILSVVPSIPSTMTNHTSSMSSNGGREDVSISASSLSKLPSSSSITKKDIISIGDESKVTRITTSPIITNMVKDRNISTFSTRDGFDQPSIHKSMDSIKDAINSNISISTMNISNPLPTFSSTINSNFSKNIIDSNRRNILNNEKIISVHNTSIQQNRTQNKGIIFYTDNQLNLHIAHRVQRQLRSIGLPIVSCSLKPMPKMGKNIVINRERGYETMFIQILTALEKSEADIIFFCEHDVLYNKDYFEFTPPDKNTWYYNQNWVKVFNDGLVLQWQADQVSQICVYRNVAIDFYRKRLETFRAGKFDRKFEPMSGSGAKTWYSKYPNIDIRHSSNLTYSKKSLSDFRDKNTAKGFKQLNLKDIQGWGELTLDRIFGIIKA